MSLDFFRLHRLSFFAFFAGLVLALLFAFVPSLRHVVDGIDRLGYFGMLIAGIMYGSALTASTSLIIFTHGDPNLNLFWVGLIGGFGAACYDTIVFLIVRRNGSHGWLSRYINRLRERRHVPGWVTPALGVIIIASPLPDELASGLMGVTHEKTFPFLSLSFAANTVGIWIATLF